MTSFVAVESSDRQQTFKWWSLVLKAFSRATSRDYILMDEDSIDKTPPFDRYSGAMASFRRTMEAMEPYGFL